MAITTSMSTRFKMDLLFGRHHFNGSRTFTATGNATQTWSGVSSLAGLSVGCFLSGTNVAPGTRITDILSANSIRVSLASTGAIGTVTTVGDTYKIALFQGTTTGTYNAATTSYADMQAEETSGAGYTAGGFTLTNVDPVISGTTAFTDFTPDPTWTSASFSTSGCMIYNTVQNGDLANPSCSVHDFGGIQQVTNGTFTAVIPTPDANNAILRIA